MIHETIFQKHNMLQLKLVELTQNICIGETANLSSAWARLFPFFSLATPLGRPFKGICINYFNQKVHTFYKNRDIFLVFLPQKENLRALHVTRRYLTIPSFHLIAVDVTLVVPSSRKVNVFVSFVSSKYGFGLKFWRKKEKKINIFHRESITLNWHSSLSGLQNEI